MTKYKRNGKHYQLENDIINGLVNERKTSGITQKVLAQRLGTEQSVVSRLENMSVSPTLRFVSKVADEIGVELVVHFRPKENRNPERNLDSSSHEYICVDCLYTWKSNIERTVMQCPQCHKRQGVQFSKYSTALNAIKDIRFQVQKSPPFKKAPPIRSLKSNIPKILKLIMDTSGGSLPSPQLPISLLIRIIEQSSQKPAVQTSRNIRDVQNYNSGNGEIALDR